MTEEGVRPRKRREKAEQRLGSQTCETPHGERKTDEPKEGDHGKKS